MWSANALWLEFGGYGSSLWAVEDEEDEIQPNVAPKANEQSYGKVPIM